MMMESFTGTIGFPDEERRPPEGGHYRKDRRNGRLPAVAGDRPVLPVRTGAASLGLERLRSLPRVRARPRIGSAVPDDGSALGVCVLPVGLLPSVRRSPVD